MSEYTTNGYEKNIARRYGLKPGLEAATWQASWLFRSDFIAFSWRFSIISQWELRVPLVPSKTRLTATETNMLVLSRKLGESVHIGDEINITVLEIRSNRIRIGIAAPASIRIQRDELWRRLLAGDDDPVVELEALNT